MANVLCVLIIIMPGTVRCLTFTANGSIDGNTSFECNTNVSLVCQTQKRNDTIKDFLILELNKTGLVNCVTRCSVNTPVLGKYIVTHNFDAGTIRLDIPNITDADANNEFTCRESSTSLSIKPVIKVFPEMSSTKLMINETNNTNVVEIKALTGCVLLQTNLTFIWNKIKYSNGTFFEPLSEEGFTIKSAYATEDSDCIPSDHCGGEAYSSTLTFTEETNGGVDYYIACTIFVNETVSENQPRNYTVISERKFVLKEEKVNNLNLDSEGCFSENGCTIGVAFAVTVAIILLLVFITPVMLRKRKSVNECATSPIDLKLLGKTETSATFAWTAGSYQEGQHTFLLCYNRLQDENSTFEENKVKGTQTTMTNLQPGRMYQCYVYAMNGKRKSNYSEAVDFTTLDVNYSVTGTRCKGRQLSTEY